MKHLAIFVISFLAAFILVTMLLGCASKRPSYNPVVYENKRIAYPVYNGY